MQDLVVSVQPTFYCENHCPYCYLGNEIRNNETLDLKTLEGRLFELSEIARISQIDLFGGELDFLPMSYLLELVKLCKNSQKKLLFLLEQGLDFAFLWLEMKKLSWVSP